MHGLRTVDWRDARKQRRLRHQAAANWNVLRGRIALQGAVDKSVEKLICVLHVTPKIWSLIYESRRHGRKDGRLGADLTSS